MTSDALNERLAHEPAEVECPICRHRQWMGAATGRCDQCGSEIQILGDRDAALARVDALVEEGRVAYLSEIRRPSGARGLFAVVANRRFRASGR